MKSWILGAMTAIALVAGTQVTAAQAQEKTVRIGTEADYAPFEFKDASGQLKGYEIELGDLLCQRAKLKCEWVNMDFDSMIAALNAHKIDAVISQMSITDERKKSVAFSDQVTIAPARFVAKTNSGITDDTATLKGKTVGVQSGTTHETYANEKLKPAGVKVTVYQSQDQAYLDLIAGRIDATLADQTVEYDWIQKTGKAQGYDYVGKPLLDTAIFGNGTGIAFRKSDTQLLAAFNKALAGVKADGSFKKINDEYFPFNIIGK